MTQTTFIKALHREAPGLMADMSRTQDQADRTPTKLKVTPADGGVLLTIMVGDGELREFLFASEADAAKFIGRLYKAITLQESAFDLIKIA